MERIPLFSVLCSERFDENGIFGRIIYLSLSHGKRGRVGNELMFDLLLNNLLGYMEICRNTGL